MESRQIILLLNMFCRCRKHQLAAPTVCRSSRSPAVAGG